MSGRPTLRSTPRGGLVLQLIEKNVFLRSTLSVYSTWRVMVCLASVYGKWVVMEDKSWHFEMDKGKERECSTYGMVVHMKEPLRMVQADYMLDMEPELVELSYPLPDVMLHQIPSDFPHMYITNDG
ncbi:unnamed protein product [Microthlaspi erraticum]|uniref:Uncharacterized protein n=1 Tax=Microthlaspi erraticum TaxID=1685480 RepID=A0A6D2KI93_9BRAS|nr:unnamed protein product [Microthlaspi erraticum]